jgi:hypothetical protein
MARRLQLSTERNEVNEYEFILPDIAKWMTEKLSNVSQANVEQPVDQIDIWDESADAFGQEDDDLVVIQVIDPEKFEEKDFSEQSDSLADRNTSVGDDSGIDLSLVGAFVGPLLQQLAGGPRNPITGLRMMRTDEDG